MIGLFVAVLTASVVGSPHCAGMCGPLSILATSGPVGRSQWGWLLATYHGARLLGYAVVGAIAGAAGAAVDLGGRLLGLQQIAAVAAGSSMVVFGVLVLSRTYGERSVHFHVPDVLDSFVRAAHRRIGNLSPMPRSFGIGVLTVLLPCGWLYAFLITAAGTANPLIGGLIMAAFWVGTLPALTVVTFGIREVTGRWRTHLPVATSLLLIATGAYLATVRAWTDYAVLRTSHSQSTPGVEAQRIRVESLPNQEMPCCHVD